MRWVGVPEAARGPLREALDAVLDPCSVAAASPLSVRELGLVRELRRAPGGAVHVTLVLTGPGCTMAPHLVLALEERLRRVPGVPEARVEVDWGAAWTPEDTPAAHRERLVHLRLASGPPGGVAR